MSRILVLMRHGKAADADSSLYDFERPLTERGREEARQAAAAMKAAGIIPDLIVASPATRTAGTAREVALVFDYPHEHVLYHAPLYMGQSGDYLDLFNHLKGDTILVVGHNPEAGNLAWHYGQTGADGFPTSSAVALKFADAAISPGSKAEVVWKRLRE